MRRRNGGHCGGHRCDREELESFGELQEPLLRVRDIRVRGEGAQGRFQHGAVQPEFVAEHGAGGMERWHVVAGVREK